MAGLIIEPPVYWNEADEEARLFTPDDDASIGRRSLLAYILLGRTIVAHPADLWQSSDSNNLIFQPHVPVVLRPLVQLDLGSSPTVTEYINDRIAKLQNDKASVQTNVELMQYSKYGKHLQSQSAELDEIFTQSGSTFPARGSRDSRFRKLIRDDLRNRIRYGPHLSACIRDGLGLRRAVEFIQLLENLTYNRKQFLSIDGIYSRLVDVKCYKDALKRIHSRLQLLHWESRSDGGTEMPLAVRVRNGILRPSDPSVFWAAVNGLAGSAFQTALMKLPFFVAIAMANELRNDPVWWKFIGTYHAIVRAVDQNQEQLSELFVAAEISRVYPSRWRQAINTKIDKWTLLSWVCHAGSWCVGIPVGFALVIRGGSAIAAIAKVHDHARKIVTAYDHSERNVLVSRIGNLIADYTRVH